MLLFVRSTKQLRLLQFMYVHVPIRMFNTPVEKCLLVEFHTILPVSDWKLGTDSSVCIRFNEEKLGNEQWDCGMDQRVCRTKVYLDPG